jgi:hypothetical protein
MPVLLAIRTMGQGVGPAKWSACSISEFHKSTRVAILEEGVWLVTLYELKQSLVLST